MPQVVIANSSPLVALIKKHEIILLQELFGEIIIPAEVSRELIEGEGADPLQKEQLQTGFSGGWLKQESVSKNSMLHNALGQGEKDVLNLGLKYPDSLLLMDEKKGRMIARGYHLKTLGTLGILMLAVQKGLKTKEDIRRNLFLLVETGFYLSSGAILAFLNQLEQI